MYILTIKKILIVLTGIFLISGCNSRSKNENFDLSGLKKPTNNISLKNDQTKKSEKKEIESKLIPLANREEILNEIAYGKKDPFSASDNQSNKFISEVKLRGFISLENKDHALVEFKKQQGIINLNSVGGINTKMLPKKTSVKEINPAEQTINLSIEGQIYTIKLNS